MKTPLTLEDGRRMTEDFVRHYNEVRRHSAIAERREMCVANPPGALDCPLPSSDLIVIVILERHFATPAGRLS